MLLDQWRREIKCSLASKLFVVGLSIFLTSSFIVGLAHAEVVTVNNNNNNNHHHHHNYNFNLINNDNNNVTNSSHHHYQNIHNNNNNNNSYNSNSNTINRTSHNHNNKAPSKINACGTRLKLEIKSICAAQKNSELVKQDSFDPESNGIFERRPVILEPSTNEIRQRRGSSESIKLIRVPRGVIQECCRTPCEPSSLLKYCSNFESSRKAVTSAPSSSSSASDESDNEVRRGSKHEPTIHSDPSGILPLILQILWNWGESKEKPFSTNVMNYHPQKLVKLVRNGSHRFKQQHQTSETNTNHHGGRTRPISTRNIDQNRWTRRQPPGSDETRRDLTSEMSTSDFQDNDDPSINNIQKNKHNDNNTSNENNNNNNTSNDNNNNDSNREKSVPSETKPIETLAKTVTDELHPEIFAMPDYYG